MISSRPSPPPTAPPSWPRSSPPIMSQNSDKLEALGDQFEVVEDLRREADVVAARPGAAPAPSGASAIRSSTAWLSLGLTLGLAGLLAGWGGADSTLALLRGLLAAGVLYHLFTGGLVAVQPTAARVQPILPALLLLGGAGAFLLKGDAPLDLPGPLFTLLGGALALASPSLGKKKDAALPAGNLRPLDPQFTQSFGAYLLAFVGMVMLPWCSSGENGAHSLFGVLTLFFLLVTMWASWVGAFKLWTFPVVTGRLGFFLFLAPMEVAILGSVGVLRPLLGPDRFAVAYSAYPAARGVEESFLQYGAGPLMALAGGVMALVVLVKGAQTATVMAKERKAAEIEARKAARSGRKAK